MVREMNAESVTGPASGDLLECVNKNSGSGPSLVQQLYQCLSVGLLALASYFFVSHFVLQTVRVVGVSMLPTLYDSQQYVLNHWVYHFRAPKQNDVVVLRDPVEHGYAVKRIIAGEGDRVVLKDGRVFVNGRRLKEPYLAPGMPTFPYGTANEQSFALGKDRYFVLGDNRKNSADSRTYGPVPRQSILGLIVR